MKFDRFVKQRFHLCTLLMFVSDTYKVRIRHVLLYYHMLFCPILTSVYGIALMYTLSEDSNYLKKTNLFT